MSDYWSELRQDPERLLPKKPDFWSELWKEKDAELIKSMTPAQLLEHKHERLHSINELEDKERVKRFHDGKTSRPISVQLTLQADYNHIRNLKTESPANLVFAKDPLLQDLIQDIGGQSSNLAFYGLDPKLTHTVDLYVKNPNKNWGAAVKIRSMPADSRISTEESVSILPNHTAKITIKIHSPTDLKAIIQLSCVWQSE